MSPPPKSSGSLTQDALARRLTALEGVGPVRAQRLARLGLERVRDLLFLLPRRLDVRGERVEVAEAGDRIGSDVHVAGTLDSPAVFRAGRRRSVLRTTLRDGDASIRVLLFNQPWMRDRLRELAQSGTTVELSGRVVETKSGPALASPRMGTEEKPLPAPGSLLPVYPTTDGVGQELLRGLIAQARGLAEDLEIEEPLADEVRAPDGLPELGAALDELHEPTAPERFEAARRRVVLEGLLPLAARLRARRLSGEAEGRAWVLESASGGEAATGGIRPTGAQTRTLDEILADLRSERPMRRLLQGDVGCGKTWIALQAALRVGRSGGQVAFMAPTELLAEQHHLGARAFVEEQGLRAALLTGSTSRAERRSILLDLAAGDLHLVFGTHALFSDDVRFARLALAIIDEQQRFGVAHKRALLDKGQDVHVLLTTATPIPRTLALALYGDLAVSLVDEAPPGRGTVRTRLVPEEKRDAAVDYLEERVAAGERVFWICPAITSDEGDGPAAEDAHAALSSTGLGRFGVELVHGRLEPEDRAARLARFRSGTSRVLVGTTVVEVGIDVPEATVCVVEGAERFGLAQLHQLRGRVGRGRADAWCFLFGDTSDAAAAPEASTGTRERLEYFAAHHDGFAIAEEDLRLRGMGELGGSRQAGFGGDGSLSDDLELFLLAQRLVEEDGELAERYLGAAPAPDLV